MDKNTLIEHLTHVVRQQRQGLVWLINIVFACASYAGAYAIRFDSFNLSPNIVHIMLASLPLAAVFKMIFLFRFKVFNGLWRYVSAHDIVRLTKAVVFYEMFFVTLTMLAWGHRIPRSVYIIDTLLSMLVFGGIRISVRLYREFKSEKSRSQGGRRFLIIGAGDAAEIATRSILQQHQGLDTIVGYIDDNPQKQERLMHGAPIFGGRELTAQIIQTYQVSDVLFAISAPPKELTEYIIETCSGLNVEFRILPSYCDIATGRIEVQKIRTVEIEDLLGRKPVQLESSDIRADLQGETIMITGAGGSIGSEIARQIASFGPARLILLDAAETPLVEISLEIERLHPSLVIDTVLCNIKSRSSVNLAVQRNRPSRIYHAAAYKHVPILESHPEQAVLNNICGTRYLAEAACANGVKRFVMISTDKAVRPSSIMGVSKRLCELVVSCMPADGPTHFAAVRFGNVLGSNGSVIPIFRRQILQGGPVTVTHPEMTRFFMTIPEAVQLVLHCGAMANKNEIFVLDMGVPIRIMTLARNMIRLSGFEPDRDIKISITGLRPGEKMHEELVTYGEELQKTKIEKINVLRRLAPIVSPLGMLADVEKLEKLAIQGESEQVKRLLWNLIRRDADSVMPDITLSTDTENDDN